MKLLAKFEGRERVVELAPGAGPGSRPVFWIDGRPLDADVSEIEDGVYSVLLDGRSYEIRVEEESGGAFTVDVRSHRSGNFQYSVQVQDPRRLRRRGALEWEGRRQIAAPMPGKVVRLLVTEGQQVQAGQGLLVVEAMKMQNEIKSPKAGVVTDVRVTEGAAVTAGQALVVIE